MSVVIAFLSLALESRTGYPDFLFRAIGHPVTWTGRLISWLDGRLNRASDSDGRRRLRGVAALAAVLAVPAFAAFLVQIVAMQHPAGIVVMVLAGSTMFAQRSLANHVGAVARQLDTAGLASGRAAVSKIVGRDPDELDRAGVCRAAIESLAENFSDGVVAPAFWFAVGGLPGAAAYKAANTADSMIGHRTPRYSAFGWASARFDDLVNLPASRLAALLLVVAASLTPGANAWGAIRAVRRDAGRHRSPNAGFPEAAMADALGLALAGPRVYDGVTVDDAIMGSGGRLEATPSDVDRAVALFWMADLLLMGLLAAIAALLGAVGLASV
jgi:adenosylcobinamide-phosphate synthase